MTTQTWTSTYREITGDGRTRKAFSVTQGASDRLAAQYKEEGFTVYRVTEEKTQRGQNGKIKSVEIGREEV